MTRIRLLTLMSAATLLTAMLTAASPAQAGDHHGGPRATTYSFSYGYGPHHYRYYYSAVGGHHHYRHGARAYYPYGRHHHRRVDFHPRRWAHGRQFHSPRFGNSHFDRHRVEDRHHGEHRFSRIRFGSH